MVILGIGTYAYAFSTDFQCGSSCDVDLVIELTKGNLGNGYACICIQCHNRVLLYWIIDDVTINRAYLQPVKSQNEQKSATRHRKVGRPNRASVTGKFCRNVPLLQLSSPTTAMDADFSPIVVVDSWRDKYVSVGFPPVMGSSLNPSSQVIGL